MDPESKQEVAYQATFYRASMVPFSKLKHIHSNKYGCTYSSIASIASLRHGQIKGSSYIHYIALVILEFMTFVTRASFKHRVFKPGS